MQMACDRIVTTIYTAADTSLDITQRVLIPDAASGLIIGHDGVRLGDLRVEANVASIQVCTDHTYFTKKIKADGMHFKHSRLKPSAACTSKQSSDVFSDFPFAVLNNYFLMTQIILFRVRGSDKAGRYFSNTVVISTGGCSERFKSVRGLP